MPRRLAAIMFTDIAGFTKLAQTDEPAALELARDQKSLVESLLAGREGRLVKSIGDGLLLEFENALDAVTFGVELQGKAQERNSQKGVQPLSIRIGVHLGDVQREGSDILGDAVNLASRIEPLAEPGGLCISEQVYAQVRNKVPYQIGKLGLRSLKGVQEPVQVFRVALPWTEAATSAGGSEVPRLAVLPLANISPDPADAYFADGLTEELISTLARVKGLRVISHTSINQYRGTAKPVAQIGSELGADHVLEGSVRKAGDQLRISVQLIDARTDEHRWAETYDRRLENVFAIQADVAERTAGALRVHLFKSERDAIREKPTESLAAYDHYLRGIQAAQSFMADSERMEAMDLEVERRFDLAIQEDPNFSAAYSALATHLVAAGGMTRTAKSLFPKARRMVAKALDLDPDSSDAHTAYGNLVMQADLNWTGADSEFHRAIALNPSSSTAHSWYGYLLTVLQRFREAETEDRAAIELDPLWPLPWYQLLSTLSNSGDLPRAAETARKLIETFGDLPGNRFGLGLVNALMGREAEALTCIEPLRNSQDLRARSGRATILSILGDPRELRRLMTDWEQGKIKHFVSPIGAAMGYSALGEKGKALDLLEREQREGDRALWSQYQMVEFDPIRDDPRFVAMIRELNLPADVSRPRWTPPPSRSL
jgi:adenylate cyclase